MKIAIIGGGFYGCYFAKKLKEKFNNKINNNSYMFHYGISTNKFNTNKI